MRQHGSQATCQLARTTSKGAQAGIAAQHALLALDLVVEGQPLTVGVGIQRQHWRLDLAAQAVDILRAGHDCLAAVPVPLQAGIVVALAGQLLRGQ
ncbi:hypothetical protein D3C80_1647930 [compost metagenome]